MAAMFSRLSGSTERWRNAVISDQPRPFPAPVPGYSLFETPNREQTLAMKPNRTLGNHNRQRLHERRTYQPEIVFKHLDRVYRGNIKNISLGGAFIETHWVNQVSRDDIVVVDIPFSRNKRYVKRKGLVKWQNNVGFAIQFL